MSTSDQDIIAVADRAAEQATRIDAIAAVVGGSADTAVLEQAGSEQATPGSEQTAAAQTVSVDCLTAAAIVAPVESAADAAAAPICSIAPVAVEAATCTGSAAARDAVVTDGAAVGVAVDTGDVKTAVADQGNVVAQAASDANDVTALASNKENGSEPSTENIATQATVEEAQRTQKSAAEPQNEPFESAQGSPQETQSAAVQQPAIEATDVVPRADEKKKRRRRRKRADIQVSAAVQGDAAPAVGEEVSSGGLLSRCAAYFRRVFK